MWIPVSSSNGDNTASKAPCSVLVHSAHTLSEPPICERPALFVEALAAVAGTTTAAPTASRPVIAATESGLRLQHAEESAPVCLMSIPP